LFKNGDAVTCAWPYQRSLKAAGAKVADTIPRRMGGQLDAVGQVEVRELCPAFMACLDPRAGRRSSSARRPNLKARDAMNKVEADSCAKYHLNEAGRTSQIKF
jgi:hypothetical protein